jgi:hypothetical protein
MVTRYTETLYYGKPTTFPEFALRCARDFSVLLVMHDAPLGAEIPCEFGPNPYYAECLQEAQEKLARVESYTPEEAEQQAAEAFQSAVNAHAAIEREATAVQARYEAMLQHARAWKPPTPDHQALQDFMIRQLEEAIEADCTVELYEVVQQTGEEWQAAEIEKARGDVAYYEKKDADERRTAYERTRWVWQLRDSLIRAEENPMSLRDDYADSKARACHECGKEVPLDDILCGEAAIQVFTGRVFHWDCWITYQRNEGLHGR